MARRRLTYEQMEDVLNDVMRELSTLKSHCLRLESNYETVLADNQTLKADQKAILAENKSLKADHRIALDKRPFRACARGFLPTCIARKACHYAR